MLFILVSLSRSLLLSAQAFYILSFYTHTLDTHMHKKTPIKKTLLQALFLPLLHLRSPFLKAMFMYTRPLQSPLPRLFLSLFIALLTCSTTNAHTSLKQYTIIINPAGNTQSTERLIDNTFERSITLQAAEALKKQLEKQIPLCTILLTRAPGRVTTQLQNAHFANSLNVDLFISLHFYQETETKPHVYIYQFSYNNEFVVKPSDFTFYRYDQSYFFNRTSSAHAARIVEKTWMHNAHAHQFTTHHVVGIPCSSLIGITSPALAFDIGIKSPTDWHTYIQPLLEGIQAIVSGSCT